MSVHKLPVWVLLLTPLFLSHLTAPDHQQARVQQSGWRGGCDEGGGAFSSVAHPGSTAGVFDSSRPTAQS